MGPRGHGGILVTAKRKTQKRANRNANGNATAESQKVGGALAETQPKRKNKNRKRETHSAGVRNALFCQDFGNRRATNADLGHGGLDISAVMALTSRP